MSVGVAIGTRLTFAPVAAPLCLAPLLFPVPGRVRIHLVLASSDLHLECKLRITRD